VFTLNQKKAHDISRHITITANAGSGKTRVLVGRYCDLVEGLLPGGPVMPERIAAITFTEKAASELRDKIAAELDNRLSDEGHRATWGRLKRGREALNSALISTIHGFCANLLRNFPIETGVPPNFRIVSGYERKRLEEEALMEGIETTLNESLQEEEGAFATARRIGRENVETVLRMMLGKRELVDFVSHNGILGRDDDTILALWEEHMISALRAMVVNVETRTAFEVLVERLKETVRPTGIELMGDLQRARSADSVRRAIADIGLLLLTSSFTLRKSNFHKEDYDELAPWAEVAGGALREAQKLIAASADADIHQRLLKDTRTLLALFDRVVGEYTQAKDRTNGLDFDDLQLRLLDALRDPKSRSTIVGSVQYLMIDEFQDTNELQYELARRLTDDLRDRVLCLVGDPKQSIYGFRNADVEVFARATREIEASNSATGRDASPLVYREQTIMPSSRSELLGTIRLDASFRLLPSICAYVNTVCGPILRRRPPFNMGVDYEDLVCARRSPGRGMVEILLARSSASADEERNEDEAPSEADLIARRIVAIVEGSEIVWEMHSDAGEEQPRAARYADIAILCRKRSMFPALEEALRRHHVPYATYGGIGFFKTQEIYDVLCYLRLLVNARDDVAALGVLRSPFFCVSDAELYRLSIWRGAERNESLWGTACARVAAGGAPPALERAVRLLTDDSAIAGRISVPMLLRRIVERTGWRGAVIGLDRGEQALANVEKLIEMARDFEEGGFTSLYDFVTQVMAMVDEDEMEGEAPVTTGRDAVALMTMHAAKGLEFPIVMLPALHSPTPMPSTPIFDRELGFGWNWSFDGDEVRPGIAALMVGRQAAREQAEEARLFYVALTRARDRLVLSGTLDVRKRRTRPTMLSWAMAPLCDPADLSAGGESCDLGPTKLRFLEVDGVTEREEEWTQQIDVGRAVESFELEERLPPRTRFRDDRVATDAIVPVGVGEIYSATQFQVHALCPTRFYLSYRLGLPEDLVDVYSDNEAIVVRDSEEGTIFARVFRRVARRLETILSDPTALSSIVDRALSLEPIVDTVRQGIRDRMCEDIRRLASSSIAGRLLSAERGHLYTNHVLRRTLGTEFLVAAIDRVHVGDDGSVRFVQFRTRRIALEQVTAAAATARAQMEFYAYMLAPLSREDADVTGSILFTDHPDHPQTLVFTRADIDDIARRIAQALGDMSTLTYGSRRDLPTSTPHCPDCPFSIGGRCIAGG